MCYLQLLRSDTTEKQSKLQKQLTSLNEFEEEYSQVALQLKYFLLCSDQKESFAPVVQLLVTAFVKYTPDASQEVSGAQARNTAEKKKREK